VPVLSVFGDISRNGEREPVDEEKTPGHPLIRSPGPWRTLPFAGYASLSGRVIQTRITAPECTMMAPIHPPPGQIRLIPRAIRRYSTSNPR